MNELKQALNDYGFFTKKSLGQNFLFDKNILSKIANGSDGICLEIGPGPGGLTEELCKRCDKVVAVEIDTKIFEFLKDYMSEYENLALINADFLKLDINKLYEEHIKKPFNVAANLPYYITTPVLMRILESSLPVRKIKVLVQKEVASRIASPPGSREYGVLSVMVQCRGSAKVLFDVPPGAFSPPPKVTSSVIEIEISETKKISSSYDDFRRCVKSGFSNRRKQLANNISTDYGISKDKVYEIFNSMGVDSDIRAEKLSFQQFDELCYNLKNI